MEDFDAMSLDSDRIWEKVRDAVDPAEEEICKDTTRRVVNALNTGGAIAASMSDSLWMGLDGLLTLADMENAAAEARGKFVHRLLEECEQAKREIAATN